MVVILVRIERSNRRVVLAGVEFSAPWTTFIEFVVYVLVLVVARRSSVALEATQASRVEPECERK